MNLTEEEKKKIEEKLKGLNDDNIVIVESPSEAVEKISPTRLKLQAISFTVIGKVQQFFLKQMIKQLKTAQSLAEAQIGDLNMPEEAKEEFLASLKENVDFLENKMANFKEHYGRLKQHAKKILATPNRNFQQLKFYGKKLYSKELYKNIEGLSSASKDLDNNFVAGQDKYVSSPKPMRDNQEYNVESIDIVAIKDEVNKALAKKEPKKAVQEAKKDFDKAIIDTSKETIFEFKDKDLSSHLDDLLNDGQIFTPAPTNNPTNTEPVTPTPSKPIFDPIDVFEPPKNLEGSFVNNADNLELDPDIQKELEEAERELREANEAKKKEEEELKEIEDRTRKEQEELEGLKKAKEEARKALEEKKRQEEETRKMAIQAQKEIEIRRQIQAKREEAAKIMESGRAQREQLAKNKANLEQIAALKAKEEDEFKKYIAESSKTDESISKYKAQLTQSKEELLKYKSAGVNRVAMAGEASPVFGDDAKGRSR